MTRPNKKPSRGREVWRVEFRDRFTGRLEGYAERKGPNFPDGSPRWAMTAGKSPVSLWTSSEAKGIAARWNKPMGTVHRLKAWVVKDEAAEAELPGLRHPAGVNGA